MNGWQRSSFCSYGACVEVSLGCPGDDVLVTATDDPEGDILRFTRAEWREFVKGVKAGEFDLEVAP